MTGISRLLAGAVIAATLLLLAACRPAAVETSLAPAGAGPAPAMTAAATSTAAPTPEPATATAPPPPSPTPSPSPTPVPPPVVRVAVPDRWRAAAEQAAAEAPGWSWELVDAGDPAAELALRNDGSGIHVRQEPLALALPFTTRWEATGRADADAIIAGGHSLVQVVPWSDMEPRLKALRVDGLHPTDEGYPYQDVWSLAAVPGFEAAAEALRGPLTDAIAPEPGFHLVAVGDIMLDRWPGVEIAAGHLEYPFTGVAPYLQNADITVGNVESSLGDIGEPAPKHYPFQAPPAAAESLALAGFDVVSLANNHAGDYGMDALLQGIDLLRAQDVAPVGAGANDAAAHAPHIAEINGLKVAFFGYVHVPVEATTNFDTASWTATADGPGLAWADPERIREDVAAVRDEVDLVVVILHSGYEYIEEPSEPQVAAAQAAAEAGADLVVGHHAHILQGVRYHQDGVIAYGLGNFAFEIDGPPETTILNVWMDAGGVRQLEFNPAIVGEGGLPRIAEPLEAAPILDRVYYLTTILNPLGAE